MIVANMTNEWIDWSGDGRIRAPLRGSCHNFINNNYTTKIAGMGLKVHSMMKSLQRPKGKFPPLNLSMLIQIY